MQILGEPAWTFPALVGNHLYLRDRREILRLDLPTRTVESPLR
ncbi:MAG TPA: hypothetical protein P5081_17550 [Phycisphaerae bacterium]|nr:hypothetical protein [Phycisphaerae bacterium]